MRKYPRGQGSGITLLLSGAAPQKKSRGSRASRMSAWWHLFTPIAQYTNGPKRIECPWLDGAGGGISRLPDNMKTLSREEEIICYCGRLIVRAIGSESWCPCGKEIKATIPQNN